MPCLLLPPWLPWLPLEWQLVILRLLLWLPPQKIPGHGIRLQYHGKENYLPTRVREKSWATSFSILYNPQHESQILIVNIENIIGEVALNYQHSLVALGILLTGMIC
jgi:hypothetical protein